MFSLQILAWGNVTKSIYPAALSLFSFLEKFVTYRVYFTGSVTAYL